MMEPQSKEERRFVERLVKQVARTCAAYELLAPGDRILVAVSGGKDSYGLLYLLERLRRRLPFSIDLLAVHVAQGQPGVDSRPLAEWLARSGIPHKIVRENTYQVVVRHVVPGQTACSVCARMRRGVLYTQAEKEGCNKIALGHHREDTLATFVMNLFYSGRLQAMPAIYRTDDGRFDVIRPLIETPESDMIELARWRSFPIVPCALCSGQEDHKRAFANQLLDRLEREVPRLKQSMLGALGNVKASHLLDVALQRTLRR